MGLVLISTPHPRSWWQPRPVPSASQLGSMFSAPLAGLPRNHCFSQNVVGGSRAGQGISGDCWTGGGAAITNAHILERRGEGIRILSGRAAPENQHEWRQNIQCKHVKYRIALLDYISVLTTTGLRRVQINSSVVVHWRLAGFTCSLD